MRPIASLAFLTVVLLVSACGSNDSSATTSTTVTTTESPAASFNEGVETARTAISAALNSSDVDALTTAISDLTAIIDDRRSSGEKVPQDAQKILYLAQVAQEALGGEAAPEAPRAMYPAWTRASVKNGAVQVIGDGEESKPKKFAGGTYKVRWEQFAPAEPNLNFRNDSSSIVVQLHQQPGVVDGNTVHIVNATKRKGSTFVTVPAGRWYVDGGGDHMWAMRFTPGS